MKIEDVANGDSRIFASSSGSQQADLPDDNGGDAEGIGGVIPSYQDVHTVHFREGGCLTAF